MDTRTHKSDLELTCNQCLKPFFIRRQEYSRHKRKGRESFSCSLSCGAKCANKKRFGQLLGTFERTCEFCHKHYVVMSSAQRFCNKTCGNKFTHLHFPASEDRKTRTSNSIKLWMKNNPEKVDAMRAKQQASVDKNGRRYSSKAERALAEQLQPLGFKRHKFIRSGFEINFDVDLWAPHTLGMIWVESDGPYHFRQVHKQHNYAKTKRRDEVETLYVADKPILLLRVNNEKFSIEKQVAFIYEEIKSWTGNSLIKTLY